MPAHSFVRLFRLTRAEYFADFLITPPVTLASIVLSLIYGATIWWPAQFAAGLLAWTLYEYLIHRFVAHRIGIFKFIHGIHHARQTDYVGSHPIITIGTYALLWWVFGVGTSSAIMVGFSVGYVWYSTVHTLFHYSAKTIAGWSLHRHHCRHHARGNVNYGVSTTLWDRVFGTLEGR